MRLSGPSWRLKFHKKRQSCPCCGVMPYSCGENVHGSHPCSSMELWFLPTGAEWLASRNRSVCLGHVSGASPWRVKGRLSTVEEKQA
jgi:hypothetical protein